MNSQRYVVRSMFGFGVLLSLLLTTYLAYRQAGYLPLATAHAQEIDILWQGDVYTPPFYKGRALWTNQAELTIVAVPHILDNGGREINPDNLTYKWWKNSEVLGTINGVGRKNLTFTGPIVMRPQNIKIEILDERGFLRAGETIEFTPRQPRILVYEDNPLLGLMLHKEVGSLYQMSSSEISLVGIPLFFSTGVRDPGFLEYNWTTAGSKSEGGGNVVYRMPDRTSGRAGVGVRISNENRIMQSAQKNFSLQLNERR